MHIRNGWCLYILKNSTTYVATIQNYVTSTNTYSSYAYMPGNRTNKILAIGYGRQISGLMTIRIVSFQAIELDR